MSPVVPPSAPGVGPYYEFLSELDRARARIRALYGNVEVAEITIRGLLEISERYRGINPADLLNAGADLYTAGWKLPEIVESFSRLAGALDGRAAPFPLPLRAIAASAISARNASDAFQGALDEICEMFKRDSADG